MAMAEQVVEAVKGAYEKAELWRIKQHLALMLGDYPSLQAKLEIAPYPYYSSSSSSAAASAAEPPLLLVVAVEGTVPVPVPIAHGKFCGSSSRSRRRRRFNLQLPLRMWLLQTYPRRPPLVQLASVPVIQNYNSLYVDASGFVSVPYIRHWRYPSCNLVDLVSNFILIFQQNPQQLLCQATSSSAAPTAWQTQTQTQPQTGSRPQSQSTFNAAPPRVLPSRGNSNLSGNSADDPSEVFRRRATEKLLENLQNDMVLVCSKMEAEMEKLLKVQATLTERQQVLEQAMAEQVREKDALERQLQLSVSNTGILQTWLLDNRNKLKRGMDMDIDKVFVECEALSKQLLSCVSADEAIDDVVYSLDRAVEQGSIGADAYAKSMRSLWRQQFYQRAQAIALAPKSFLQYSVSK